MKSGSVVPEGNGTVGRCRLPCALKARLVSTLETKMWWTSFKLCFQTQPAPLQHGRRVGLRGRAAALLAHTVPVHTRSLLRRTACSYCTGTHSQPPPPHCLLILYRYTLAASSAALLAHTVPVHTRSLLLPGLATRYLMYPNLVPRRCSREAAHSQPPPPWPGHWLSHASQLGTSKMSRERVQDPAPRATS